MKIKSYYNLILKKVKQNKLLVSLFCLTFFAKLFSVLWLGFQVNIYNDSSDYLVLAHRLASLDFENYLFERTPTYPLLIAFTGFHLKLLIGIQYLLNTVIVYLVFKISRTILAEKKAFFVALVPLITINYYFYERAVLTEVLTLFLVVWIVYLFCVAKENYKIKLAIGILCAALMFTRTHFLFFAPAIVCVHVLYNYNRKIKLLFVDAFLFLTPTFLCFMLWCGMNEKENGYYALTPYLGINLAQTSVTFFDKYEGEHQKIKEIYVKHIQLSKQDATKHLKSSIWYAYDELLLETGYNLPQLSNVLAVMSKELIAQNQQLYWKQVVVSFTDFWTNDLYWMRDDLTGVSLFFFNVWRRFCKLFQLIFNGLFLVAALITTYQFLFLKRKVPKMLTFCFSTIIFASVTQAMIIYGDNSRFSFPFYPFIVLLTVYFISQQYNYFKTRF